MTADAAMSDWNITRGEDGGLAYVEVAAGAAAADAPLVIGLHGRGGSAASFASLLGAHDPRWRYLFPQAPIRLDVPGHDDCFSWYEPIMSAAERQNSLRDGIPVSPQLLAARAQLHGFLRAAHERLAVPPARSALIGFSQGGALSLDVGLRADPPYAALAALCSYLPEADDLPLDRAAARAQPLLLVHGIADDPMCLGAGRRARRVLVAGGLPVDDHEFPIGHEIAAPAQDALAAFLRRSLPPT